MWRPGGSAEVLRAVREDRMIDLTHLEAWFVTGSQHLYGPETLKKVEEHATAIARSLAASAQIPVKIVAKPVMTGSDSIRQLCLDADNSKNCIGLVTWMHTFSPARMWIDRKSTRLNSSHLGISY